MSLTNVECQSPVTMTGLDTRPLVYTSVIACRDAGKPSQASCQMMSPLGPSWSSRAIITLLARMFQWASERRRPSSSQRS